MDKVTVSVRDLANRTTLHEFTLDPTKATYVVPEGSKLGFIFEPEGSKHERTLTNDPKTIPAG